MLTYVPICHFQGAATRSAVRATPRNPVSAPAVRATLPKSKATTVFHLLKMKGEFMSIHRISCFKLFKASDTSAQAPDISRSTSCDSKTKNSNDTSIFIDHYTKEKRQNGDKDKFSTPPSQIRDVDSLSIESVFSEITVSTFHEDIEEYKRRNSSAGFWFPVIPDNTRVVSESRPQIFLGSKYASLADASRSQQARFQKQLLEAKRYMINPEDRLLETFINNILATLATMFPQFAHELLAMKETFFIDFINAKAYKQSSEESKIRGSLLYPMVRRTDLTQGPDFMESVCCIAEKYINRAEKEKNFNGGTNGPM